MAKTAWPAGDVSADGAGGMRVECGGCRVREQHTEPSKIIETWLLLILALPAELHRTKTREHQVDKEGAPDVLGQDVGPCEILGDCNKRD